MINNDSDDDGIVDMYPSDTEIAGGDPDLAWIQLDNPSFTGTEDSDVSGGITVYFPANIKAYLQQKPINLKVLTLFRQISYHT